MEHKGLRPLINPGFFFDRLKKRKRFALPLASSVALSFSVVP